jgi:hypothetical protein
MAPIAALIALQGDQISENEQSELDQTTIACKFLYKPTAVSAPVK